MKHLTTLIVSSLLLLGCRAPSTPVQGDPVVLPATQPANLLYPNLDSSRGVTVRSTYLPTPATITYAEGADYTLDRRNGTVARTPTSRIPDFSKNTLYNQKNFNHTAHPGYGNLPHTVYVSYHTHSPSLFSGLAERPPVLPRITEKLRAGAPVRILAFGDSITAGGDATSPDLQYPALFATHLQQLYPQSKVTLENVATGGDTTRNGLDRLQDKVLSRSPDLVLVAFGMNDHNVGSVPLDEFERNLTQIVSAIRAKTGADCILLSAFDPHEDWMFGTHNMAAYAQTTQRVAQQTQSAYADVYALWQKVRVRKDQPSLLGNNINHPNDFGHWLYLQSLKTLKF